MQRQLLRARLKVNHRELERNLFAPKWVKFKNSFYRP